jgi:hypothetical protein
MRWANSLKSSCAATRLNNDADTNGSQGPPNGKSRKPLLHCTRAACHATVRASRDREREQQIDSILRDQAARIRFPHHRGEPRSRHPGVESTLAAEQACPPPHGGEVGCQAACRGGYAHSGPGAVSRSRHPGLLDVGACPPVVRYESIRRGTLRILRRYCSDRTEPARRFPKV